MFPVVKTPNLTLPNFTRAEYENAITISGKRIAAKLNTVRGRTVFHRDLRDIRMNLLYFTDYKISRIPLRVLLYVLYYLTTTIVL